MIRVGKTNIEEHDLIDRVMHNLHRIDFSAHPTKAVVLASYIFSVTEEVAIGLCQEYNVKHDTII